MSRIKTLIVINGPMGVGKTTVSRELCRLLTPSIFLDGDWCWDLHPFSVTEATRSLVTDNIRSLLSRDLRCEEIDYVVFCWVLQYEETALRLLEGLDPSVRVLRFTLDVSDEELARRLQADISAGRRDPDSLGRGLDYQRFYPGQHTIHLDTTALSPAQAAARIADRVRRDCGFPH